MKQIRQEPPSALIGIGIYTPAEARRYTHVPAARIRRWLRGHAVGGMRYEALWLPQIDIGDDRIYLGFRDLTEVRVVDALIKAGLSAQKLRRAIEIARDRYGLERPLSTNAFRTDGKNVFLLLSNEGEDRVVDIFTDQYAIKRVIEPSFRGLDFNDEGVPTRWHISRGVVLDPERSFGQPIEVETLVPTHILAAAVEAEGSVKAAARAYEVSIRAVNQALAFEQKTAA
jgi:uncharacterized protein (DUF433 family)